MIAATLVNELRQKTGAGMMDCKNALVETSGNIEDAIMLLRKKGLSSAAKKADRATNDGLVAVCVSDSGKKGAILEINAETDFVAKNEIFQRLCTTLAKDYLNFEGKAEDFASASSLCGKTVRDAITDHIATIGENIALGNMHHISADNGVVVGYVHNQATPGLGKMGVLVAFETDISAEKVNEIGKQIAMHIAASAPESVSTADLSPTLIEREKTFIREQSAASGKPAAVIEKMIEGRLSKFYEQVVLLEQPFVRDSSLRVREVLEAFAKDNGGKIAVKSFVRILLGQK